MKKVQVTFNPTEIKGVNYSNSFTKKPGEKFSLQVRSEVAIKLNPVNPVSALVAIHVFVEDPDKCIQLDIKTITYVTVSTFIDDLEGFIRAKYLPVVVMASNEKIRNITTLIGLPVRLPSPVFIEGDELGQPEELTQ